MHKYQVLDKEEWDKYDNKGLTYIKLEADSDNEAYDIFLRDRVIIELDEKLLINFDEDSDYIKLEDVKIVAKELPKLESFVVNYECTEGNKIVYSTEEGNKIAIEFDSINNDEYERKLIVRCSEEDLIYNNGIGEIHSDNVVF